MTQIILYNTHNTSHHIMDIRSYCSVCSEPISSEYEELTCTHKYHKECIVNISQCLLCKEEIPLEIKNKIHLEIMEKIQNSIITDLNNIDSHINSKCRYVKYTIITIIIVSIILGIIAAIAKI